MQFSHNYMVTLTIVINLYFQFDTMHEVRMVSNTQVCSSISDHILCSPQPSITFMAIRCNFTRALAVVFQSVLECSCPCTRDSPMLFRTLFLASVHANASFEAFLGTSHLFSNTPLYGHMVAILILTNFYRIMIFAKINIH